MTTNKNRVKSWIALAKGTGLSGSVMDAIRIAYARNSDKATINKSALSEFDHQLLASWGYEPEDKGNVIEVAV